MGKRRTALLKAGEVLVVCDVQLVFLLIVSGYDEDCGI